MKYPIVIHKEPDSDHEVMVPDLLGCVATGVTVEEALSHAIEAIESHIKGLLQEGEDLPLPQTVDFHREQKHYRSGVWSLVNVNVNKLAKQLED